MAIAPRFKVENNILIAPERIDEITDPPETSSINGDVLKIDFAKLKILNSYGVRLLINLTRDWEPRPVEFHNCQPVLIDSINIVRALLGVKANPQRIISLYVPFQTVDGRGTELKLVKYDEIKWEDDRVVMPGLKDTASGEALEPDIEPEEYFAFMLF